MKRIFFCMVVITTLLSCHHDLVKGTSIEILNKHDDNFFCNISIFTKDSVILSSELKHANNVVYYYETAFGNEDSCPLFNADSCVIYKTNEFGNKLDSVKFSPADKSPLNVLNKDNYKVENIDELKHSGDRIKFTAYEIEISNCFPKGQ